MRPIDADRLKEAIVEEGQRSKRYKIGEFWELNRDEIWKAIDEQPTVQPERKHGKWERHYSRPNVYADLCWHCSACGYKTAESWANHFKFCPECGADMRKGEPNANN